MLEGSVIEYLRAGARLGPLDHIFLMVIAGFSMVLARSVRVPRGFVLGCALAFNLLRVAMEEALLMILFTESI